MYIVTFVLDSPFFLIYYSYMKCSLQHFDAVVYSNSPSKWRCYEQNPITSANTVFYMDTLGETSLNYKSKYRLAYFVWEDGMVTQDLTGLFGNGVINPLTPKYTTPKYTTTGSVQWFHNSVPMTTVPVNVTVTINGEPSKERYKQHKCECGAHSVGSNRHSNWCQAKEI